MNLNKDNILSRANKTTSSFYSTSSFNKRLLTSSTLSNTKIFDKNNRIPLRDYHKNYLKLKLSKNEKIMKTIDTESNQLFLTKLNPELLLDEEEYTGKYKTLSKDSFIPIQLKKYNIYPYYSLREDNLSDFKRKIKSERKAKMTLKILKKEKTNLLESQKTEIDRFKLQIFQLYYSKDLLDKYTFQLRKYCKFLSKFIEKEKTTLRKIMLKEIEIKSFVKDLQSRVEKKKQSIIDGENFRNFLLRVKYKVSNLKDLPLDIIKIYKLEKYLPAVPQPKKPLSKRNSIYGRRKSFNENFTKRSSFFKKRGSVVLSKPTQKENKIFKKEETIPPPVIYHSFEEYDNDVHNIKLNIIKLFSIHKEQNKELVNLKIEQNHLLQKGKIKDEKDNYEFEKLSDKLTVLKNDNIKLSNTLETINTMKAQRKAKRKIYEKLIKIINNLPINVEKQFGCEHFYSIINSREEYFLYKGNKQDSVLFCLTILEQILMSTITKLNTFNRGIKNSLILALVKAKVENEKRRNNNKINIELKKEREKQRNENILQKFNKVLYLPRRKINTVYKATINSRNRSEGNTGSGKSYELKLENVLFYE